MSRVTRFKTFEGTLHGQDAIEFVAAMAQLDALLEASATVVHDALDRVAPDSLIDRANKARRRDPYEQARLLLASAEDHLMTVLMILKSNVLPMFSPFSLLRPAAEADVRIAYLVDPEIDEMQRLARGLNLRLESLEDQNRVKPDAGILQARVATLEKKAVANGITPLRSKPKTGLSRIVGFGEPRQKDVVLFRSYLKEGEFIYRFLSAHIHSKPWVMISADKALPTDDPEVGEMPMALDIPSFVAILAVTLALHERNIERLITSGGYPPMVWTKTKQSALERARAKYVPLLTPTTKAPSDVMRPT
jgi:hypothetical protein